MSNAERRPGPLAGRDTALSSLFPGIVRRGTDGGPFPLVVFQTAARETVNCKLFAFLHGFRAAQAAAGAFRAGTA